jgi:hypothetical protein
VELSGHDRRTLDEEGRVLDELEVHRAYGLQ